MTVPRTVPRPAPAAALVRLAFVSTGRLRGEIRACIYGATPGVLLAGDYTCRRDKWTANLYATPGDPGSAALQITAPTMFAMRRAIAAELGKRWWWQ